MNDAGTDVFGQVGGLEARGMLMRKRGIGLLIAAAVALFVAAACALSGWALGPSAQPGSIHVPNEILATFSDQVVGSAGSFDVPFESFAGKITGLFTGPVISTLAIFVVVIGGGVLIFGGEPGSVFRSLAMILVTIGIMALATNMVSTITGSGWKGEEEPSLSPQKQFMAAVDSKDFADVFDRLKGLIEGERATAAYYVLAQVAVAAELDHKPGQRVVVQKAAASLSMPHEALGFTPRGNAAYAIELSAYGSPKSSLAKQYQHDQDETAATWWGIAGITAIIGLILAVAATAVSGLATAINRRVRRVRDLLVMEPGAEP
ncbi:hypothetical protein F7T25_15810 [Salmonella enterica]|nr:hypothetical protein [Salmonella enterica]